MKGFKGTDKDGKCCGFQYEENHDYEFESAELCKSGGHFCTEPLDVFKYYAPGSKSRYFTVETADEDVSSQTDDVDSKKVTKKLHIGEEIDIKGLIEAHINLVNENIHKHIKRGDSKVAIVGCKGAATVGYNGIAVAGDWGAAITGRYGAAIAGYKGVAKVDSAGVASVSDAGVASAGYKGIATAGNRGVAMAGVYGVATAGRKSSATAGRNGKATAGNLSTAKAGNFGMAMAGSFSTAIAGNYGVATTGDYSTAIAGDRGIATSRGSSSVGANGSALARGQKVKVCGELGAVLVLVEEEECSHGDIKDWRAFVVDGENYKPNTWYQLKDGEVVEVEEENE